MSRSLLAVTLGVVDGGPTTRRSEWAIGGLFALTYLAMVLLGRATRPEGAPLAVVWPAAAVGFLWLAWAGGRRRRTVLSAVAIALVSSAVNTVTGAGWTGGLVLGACSAIQASVACWVVRRRHARTGTPGWRLRSLEDLTTLLVASYAGAGVAAAVGILGLTHSYTPAVLLTFVTWVLRLGTSTFVIAAVVLCLVDPDRTTVPPRRRREALGLVLTMAAAYALVFAATVHLPLAFAMVPLSLWVALRFSTTVAAAHVLGTGTFVVVSTLRGLGPFGDAPALETRALLTQAFITVVGAVTLVLALHRDERVRLVEELRAAHLRAEDQAQLMSTVLAEMDEGIALVGADGHFLLRNRASLRLVGAASTQEGQRPDPARLGLFHPDGRPCTREEMADSRALRGERLEQDYVLRLADGTERTLATRAAPLTTASGERQALVVFSDATAVRRAAADVARAADEAARARDLFSGVLDAATELSIIGTDVRGRITVFNVGAERLLGYSADEVLGRPAWVLHDAADAGPRLASAGLDLDDLLAAAPLTPEQGAALRSVALGTQPWTMRTCDGRAVRFMTTLSPMRAHDGTVTGFMAASRDLTAELEARADLADSEERFRLAFERAPMGLMMIGLTDGTPATVLQVNPAMTTLVGHDEAQLVGMPVGDLSHPDDLALTTELLEGHRTGRTSHTTVETRYRHRDSSTVWIRLSTSVVRPHDGEPYSLALIEDITARKQAETALTHQAMHDALTGLPNRRLFMDRLDHALAAAERSVQRTGVLYLDLDGFKAVNDIGGHEAGDQLLQRLTVRLTGCLRPGDTLGRLGGDEFAVVCPDLDSGDDAGDTALANLRAVADRLLAAVRPPVTVAAGTFTVGVSIGMALAEPGAAPGAVLKSADDAMYCAKRAGKNRVHTG